MRKCSVILIGCVLTYASSTATAQFTLTPSTPGGTGVCLNNLTVVNNFGWNNTVQRQTNFNAAGPAFVRFVWTTSASYTFTGSEMFWQQDTLNTAPGFSGNNAYLHLQAYNDNDNNPNNGGTSIYPNGRFTFGPYDMDVTAPAISGVTPNSNQCVNSGASLPVTANIVDPNCAGVVQQDICLLGPNLLTNPSFEGNLNGWTQGGNLGWSSSNSGGYPAPNRPTPDGTSYVASASAAAMSAGTPLRNPDLRQTVGVVPGQRYALSVWVWTKDSPNACQSFLLWKDGAGAETLLKTYERNTAGWQQLFATVIPASANLTLILRLQWDPTNLSGQGGGDGGGGNFDVASVRTCTNPTTFVGGTASWTSPPITQAGTLTISAIDGRGNASNANTAAVNINPAAPTAQQATPAAICAGASSTLSATAGSGGDQVQWFTGSCGGTLVGTGNQVVSPASTTTYYARTRNSTTTCTSSSCVSVTVTVNSSPLAPTGQQASPAAICLGGSSTLSAAAGSGGDQVQWFTGSCGGTLVGTGNQVVSPAATTTYFARTRNSGTTCTSASCVSVTVTVNPLPTTPSGQQASPSTICAGASTTLSATAGSGGDQVEWFTGSCGGTLIGTGNQVVSPAVNTTYFARTRNSSSGCSSTNCASVAVTVNSSPAQPTGAQANPTSICSGQTATLSATVAAGETVDWFTTSCGGASVGSGTSIIVTPAATTTYFARARNTTTTCSSTNCATVTVTVITTPAQPVNPQASPPTICVGGSSTLSAAAGAGGDQVQWFSGSCGGTLIGTGNQTVSPALTTTYYARTRNSAGDCVSSSCGSVTVTVASNPSCTIDGSNPVCGGTTNSYGGPAGMSSYNWSIAGSGSISGPSNAQSVSIVAGASGSYTLTLNVMQAGCAGECSRTVNINPVPPPTIICQSISAGISAGGAAIVTASSIDNGSSADPACGQTIINREIAKGNVACDAPGFGASVSFTCNELGNQPVTLRITQTDGQQRCCSATVTVNDDQRNCTCGAPSASCKLSYSVNLVPDGQGGGIATLQAADIDNNSRPGTGTCTIDTAISKDGVNFGPSVTLTCQDYGTRIVTLKVTQSDSQTVACITAVNVMDPQSLCACPPPTARCRDIARVIPPGGQVTITASEVNNGSFAGTGCALSTIEISRDGINFFPSLSFSCSEAGVQDVTLRVNQFDGQSATCPAHVTISGGEPQPPSNVAANPPAACLGGSSTLTATPGSGGDNVAWYADSCGGTLLGSGVSLAVSPTSPTTYYVRTTSTNSSCVSACASVLVTVNPIPNPPLSAQANPPSIQPDASSILSAVVGVGETVDWYTGSCGGTLVGSGASIAVSPIITTTYHARTRNLQTGCSSSTCASATVIVTPIALTSAYSRRQHSAAGAFDVPLNLKPQTNLDISIEPRINGVDPQMILTLEEPVVALDGAVNCGQEIIVTNGTCGSVEVSGNTMIIHMTFLKNTCVDVQVAGLAKLGPPVRVNVLTREGDVATGGAGVNILDLQAVKNGLNQLVGERNFILDVNLTGNINILDLQVVKNNLNRPVTPCP